MESVNMQSEKENKLNLVLVGEKGVGKSASGSTILGVAECECDIGEIVLDEEEKPSSVSLKKNTRRVQVVDMPEFEDTHLTEDEVNTEMAKCVSLSVPGIHAFLLVVPIGQLTDSEIQAACKVAEVFGEDALKHHTIVVFSRGDELQGKKIEQYLEVATDDLKILINRCGGRYHVLNNRDRGNNTQVKELIEKVDQMQGNKGLFVFREAEAAIRGEKKRRSQSEQKIKPATIFPEVLERVKIEATGLAVGALLRAVCPFVFARFLVGKSVGLVAGIVMKTSAAVGETAGALIGGAAGLDANSCKEGALKKRNSTTMSLEMKKSK